MTSFTEIGFGPADILLPKNTDMEKWSVVACDQYTSEPDYWDEVKSLTAGNDTTLNITFPEIYLEQGKKQSTIAKINQTMEAYLEKGLFCQYSSSMVYVERTVSNGRVRKGIVGAVDLEQYDYTPGCDALIRATEGTVLERIPPRVEIRQNAPLESPHIMMLFDDPDKTVIEPLSAKKSAMKQLYSFDLMMGGGHIEGYLIDDYSGILSAIAKTKNSGMTFAVGDGNHSLATAKACWEQVKQSLSGSELETHPARYALCEIVNIHDDALEFEPIHRIVFDVDPEQLIRDLKAFYPDTEGTAQEVTFLYRGNVQTANLYNTGHNLAVGAVQAFLDGYLPKCGGKLDYIHGRDTVQSLSSKDRALGILLPSMHKSELFETVIKDGVLPRKTFSMGEAQDKRFYLECRKIK